MPETKFTRQEVARMLAASARANKRLEQGFRDDAERERRAGQDAQAIVSDRVAETFHHRWAESASLARDFLNESPERGWRLWAPEAIRIRASRRARTHIRRLR